MTETRSTDLERHARTIGNRSANVLERIGLDRLAGGVLLIVIGILVLVLPQLVAVILGVGAIVLGSLVLIYMPSGRPRG